MFDWIFFAIVLPVPGILLVDLVCTHIAKLDLIYRAGEMAGEFNGEKGFSSNERLVKTSA